MSETTILFLAGPFTVTAFGVCVMLGALAGMVLAVLLGRKNPGVNATLSLALATTLGAVLGGRAVYCLTMLDFILVDLGGAGFIPQLWQGGYTLYGAVLGGGAGAYLYARAAKKPVGRMLDLAAVGGAVALMAERIGEKFTSQGLGEYLWEDAWCRFPFAVQSVYEDWQIPVFFYEALAALMIAVVLALTINRKAEGRGAETFIILLGVTQVILESLREDEFIRFGFVRFSQLAAAITMAAVLFLRLARCVKQHGWTPWQVIRLILFLAGIVGIILIEFALDKSTIDNVILYFVMAGTLIIMAISMLIDGKKSESRH